MATKVKKKVRRKTTTATPVRKAVKDSERIKTFRVLKDGMRVGYSVRNFGDFMPEAKTLPTLRSLLNTNCIEEVWVDKEEFDEWEADQAERDAALAEEMELSSSGVEDDDDAVEAESRPVRKVKPKKKVAKKSKKTVVKKGKTSGRKLEQQPV